MHRFLYDAHLHPTFLFDRFKCLMLFTISVGHGDAGEVVATKNFEHLGKI